MRFNRGFTIGLLAGAALLGAVSAYAADGQTMTITGEDYTKWLWGNQHTDGSVYNFTTVPGEGYGDNGQGTEIDLYLASKPSKYVEVTGRLQSRFNQNQWTNFGGFGGHRLLRPRHVRSVHHRQDPLHRPRQRQGRPLPGTGRNAQADLRPDPH